MKHIIQLLIIIALLISGVFYLSYSSYVEGDDCTTVQVLAEKITVEKGDTFSSVLREHSGSEYFSKVYLRLTPPGFQLQAGSYQVITTCGIDDFIESLKKPMNETDIFLTFLEGWNIYDIDEYLVEEGYINAGEFIAEAKQYEGYLYPDTYAINPNTFSVSGLIEKMRNNFTLKTQDIIPSSYSQEEIHELIILASIVEKEEKNPDEKSTVAGILKKRLDEGWMLGADITVCYAFALTAGECKLSVTKYLYEKNDYNTRQMAGLPAGPIGNPSAETIEATLNYKETPYYYYLHDVDTGEIYYGRNEAEHNRNKQLYIN